MRTIAFGRGTEKQKGTEKVKKNPKNGQVQGATGGKVGNEKTGGGGREGEGGARASEKEGGTKPFSGQRKEPGPSEGTHLQNDRVTSLILGGKRVLQRGQKERKKNRRSGL